MAKRTKKIARTINIWDHLAIRGEKTDRADSTKRLISVWFEKNLIPENSDISRYIPNWISKLLERRKYEKTAKKQIKDIIHDVFIKYNFEAEFSSISSDDINKVQVLLNEKFGQGIIDFKNTYTVIYNTRILYKAKSVFENYSKTLGYNDYNNLPPDIKEKAELIGYTQLPMYFTDYKFTDSSIVEGSEQKYESWHQNITNAIFLLEDSRAVQKENRKTYEELIKTRKEIGKHFRKLNGYNTPRYIFNTFIDFLNPLSKISILERKEERLDSKLEQLKAQEKAQEKLLEKYRKIKDHGKKGREAYKNLFPSDFQASDVSSSSSSSGYITPESYPRQITGSQYDSQPSSIGYGNPTGYVDAQQYFMSGVSYINPICSVSFQQNQAMD